MAEPTKLDILRGDRFSFRVTFTQNGAAYVPSANSQDPVMQMRADPSQATPDAVFDVAYVAGQDNAVFSLPSTTTLGLPVGTTYYARVLMQHTGDPDLDEVTAREYVFTVKESATRR